MFVAPALSRYFLMRPSVYPEQIVPLGPGLQKLLQGVVVFAPQADVGGKIDGRRGQHEVAEIRIAVLRDERSEDGGDHRIGASRGDGERDRGDVVQLDAGRLWRHLLQDDDIRRAEHRRDLDFRLVVILPSGGLEPFVVDRVPVEIVGRAGEVDHQCPFRRCLQPELQVGLIGLQVEDARRPSGLHGNGFDAHLFGDVLDHLD